MEFFCQNFKDYNKQGLDFRKLKMINSILKILSISSLSILFTCFKNITSDQKCCEGKFGLLFKIIGFRERPVFHRVII